MGVAPMAAEDGECRGADNVHNFAAAIAEVSQRAATQELLPAPTAVEKLGKENQLPFAGDGHVVLKLGVVTTAGCVHRPARLCLDWGDLMLTRRVSVLRCIFLSHPSLHQLFQ